MKNLTKLIKTEKKAYAFNKIKASKPDHDAAKKFMTEGRYGSYDKKNAFSALPDGAHRRKKLGGYALPGRREDNA